MKVLITGAAGFVGGHMVECALQHGATVCALDRRFWEQPIQFKHQVEFLVQVDPSRVRRVDVPVMIGDSTKFRKATQWSPKYSIETTLRDTLEYWRSAVKAIDHSHTD